MDSHTGFIVAAYAVTFLVLGGTVAAVLIDYRVQRRALARLSAADGRRPATNPEGNEPR